MEPAQLLLRQKAFRLIVREVQRYKNVCVEV